MKRHLELKQTTWTLRSILLVLFSCFLSTSHGNVPLHEWTSSTDQTISTVNENGEKEISIPENLTTWIFEDGTFIPQAKLQGDKYYSIITDHLGTPTEAYNEEGQKVWSRELGIYGQTRKETGVKNFVPYLYQGQYLDVETELAYNRFRYYSPDSGIYISQDPIRLDGGFKLYEYVHNVNSWIDPAGLSSFLFRADDAYKGGDIGVPLGGDADITDPYTHVQNKKSGQSSIYTSFGEDRSKLTPKFGTKTSKVKWDELRKLEAEGKIKILMPDDVEKMIGGKDGKNAARSMRNNAEVLIEGVIPGSIVKKC